MFTSFTPPPALVSTEIVSAYVAPPRASDIIDIDHSSVKAESQNTSIRMECSVEFAIACSRTALVSIGYHVLQIGHYRLLACKNGTSNTFDLSFCKVGRNDTEIVFTQLQSAAS
jgi:hypothetical protein